MKLDGKSIVITGAAGNIGAAAARRCISEGARVMLVDSDAQRIGALIDELDCGSQAFSCVADVTSPESVRGYAALAHARFGKVDGFLNNAGIEGPIAPLAEFPEDGFTQVIAVNVTGVFLGMKYMLPIIRDGGSIVITSSVGGLKGTPNFVAYVTSKHAVIGIMRTAAQEAAPRRIRVNSIHPGMVESQMMRRIENSFDSESDAGSAQALFRESIALGRYVEVDEVADGMLYLLGDESRMVTGTMLVVDGGFLL